MATDELVAGEPEQGARFAVVNCGRLYDDQADMTLGVADIAVADCLVDEAVLTREPRHHRRHHHAVRKPQPVDGERLEEPHEFAPGGASTWLAITSFWISLVPS